MMWNRRTRAGTRAHELTKSQKWAKQSGQTDRERWKPAENQKCRIGVRVRIWSNAVACNLSMSVTVNRCVPHNCGSCMQPTTLSTDAQLFCHHLIHNCYYIILVRLASKLNYMLACVRAFRICVGLFIWPMMFGNLSEINSWEIHVAINHSSKSLIRARNRFRLSILDNFSRTMFWANNHLSIHFVSSSLLFIDNSRKAVARMNWMQNVLRSPRTFRKNVLRKPEKIKIKRN